MSPLTGIVIAATGIGGKPDPNGLPGSPALEQLVNGLAFWGLLAAVAGLVISAAVWALSAHSGNYHHAASRSSRDARLGGGRLPRRCRARDRRVLREPRQHGQVVTSARGSERMPRRRRWISGAASQRSCSSPSASRSAAGSLRQEQTGATTTVVGPSPRASSDPARTRATRDTRTAAGAVAAAAAAVESARRPSAPRLGSDPPTRRPTRRVRRARRPCSRVRTGRDAGSGAPRG